ncbi:hypothetical protein [Pseudomarimonas salicorniae]|uniref:Tfp pilus assembly protein PilN n=1 Tax=Pseudomarimonas salicorniae TaxID=2933270 RepID=A0ABT0GEI4_9GAMM|nr:hypothetical protein [Lysobacter sp. CAU 1642]MCK7592843.1 hypothetical protein [Lysobacter sp. CAU 1642]
MSLLAMSLRRDSLRRAGMHIGIAAAMLVVGAAALLVARADIGDEQRSRSEAEAQLAALQGESAGLEESLAMLEGNVERYRSLERGGFIGGGDRIAWTEALLRVQQRLGLPETSFELAPQQMLEPPMTDPSLPPVDGQTAAASGPLAHDLRIQIQRVHEGEVLALLAQLKAEQVGFFRVQRCKMERDPRGIGLALDCTLRWVTYLPPPAPEPEFLEEDYEEAAP